MKRSAQVDPAKAKKQKTSHTGQNGQMSPEEQNFQPILRRSFQYLVAHTKVEKPPGHIQGMVKMIYPPAPGKERFTLELADIRPVEEGAKQLKQSNQSPFLEVMLSKLHLENLDPLAPGMKVKLSLKGGRIEQLGTRKTTLPVRLVFTEGYHLRFGKKDVVDINTFHAPLKSKLLEPKVEPTFGASDPCPHTKRLPYSIYAGQADQRREAGVSLLQNFKTEPPTQLPPNTGQKQEDAANISASRSIASPALKMPEPFIALNNLPKMSSSANVIGVVIKSQPAKKCQSGDWMKGVRIRDCSLPDPGIGVNLFLCRNRPREEDINPELGDVVILVNLNVGKSSGTPLVGWSRGYRWAILSKKTKLIYWTNVDQTEPPAVKGDYIPFYKPGSGVVNYCQQLLDEWETKDESRDQGPVGVPARTSWSRKHRLISELKLPVSHSSESYFDCTVEVLRFFESNRAPHTLWVTDYTQNEQCFTPSAEWYPEGLAPYIFRIECWDDSIIQAQALQENVFCQIKNCRFKASSTGHLEGKQVESKIQQLAETADDEHLKEMIQRKRTWEKQTGHSVTTMFEDGLLKDAKLDRFLNSTVEILHHEYSEEKASGTVFCTDYTLRNDTGGVPRDAPWAEGLDLKRILKIVLVDGQAPVANMVKRGDYCRFNKMRLKFDSMHKYTIGFVGGNQSLLEKLNPKNKDNEMLQGLIRRKEALLFRKLDKTFKDIFDSKRLPAQYRLRGRIVAQDPKNLDEAVSLWCSKCARELNSREKMCIKCELDDDLVGRCNLYLNIEDLEPTRAFAHVPETSSILTGVDLRRFLDDPDIQDTFRQRIWALSGGPKKDGAEEVKPPLLALDIRAWLDEKNEVCLLLTGATPCSV